MNGSEQQKDSSTPGSAEAAKVQVEAEKEKRREAGEKKRASRRAGYIGGIVWNAVFLFVLNNLVNWNVPFIAPSWVAVLWAINLSLGVTILANIVFLAYDPPWFRYAERVVSGLLALLSTYVIYTIFPFELPDPTMATVVQWCLIIVMAASVIGTIIALVKLLSLSLPLGRT